MISWPLNGFWTRRWLGKTRQSYPSGQITWKGWELKLKSNILAKISVIGVDLASIPKEQFKAECLDIWFWKRAIVQEKTARPTKVCTPIIKWFRVRSIGDRCGNYLQASPKHLITLSITLSFFPKIVNKNLVVERLAWVLTQWARKERKLLAQRENLLVLDDQTGVFFEPWSSESFGRWPIGHWLTRFATSNRLTRECFGLFYRRKYGKK